MHADRVSLRVEVLGPLRLLVDGAPVEVRGPKRRAVLALLALAEGRTVTVDHLIDALWPAEAPESGRQALHSHVSRLRAQLGPAAERLTTFQDGYRLDLRGDQLDLAQARRLLAAARGADVVGGLATLEEAHGLWRGPALAELRDVPSLAAAAEGCARLHGEVSDALVTAAVAAGRAGAAVDLAATSVTADPLREPAVLLLMRALAATGRAPEALRSGREYRRRLAEETGLDPSPALDELERDVASGVVRPASRLETRVGRVPVRAEPAARPPTPLLGREEQVAALHRLLEAERLVTVLGPGGVGKTRLAIEVAARSEAATVLLLAPVTDAAAIPHALAATMNLTVTQGDVLAACLAVLGDQPGLLVIDNCEHLLDAVRDTVGMLLASCPGLTVLATSREPLAIAAEYAYRLAPLELPELDQDPARAASVAVFLDRAGRVRPDATPTPADLDLVADIVRRLDGMPLAIELAAGRLSTFSLADLHRRLDRSLDLLGGGRPSGESRHRTLRATMQWSYELLTDDEQRLFRHLSVFVDGVDLDAAERLAADLRLASDPGSVLARLVDASMIEAAFDAVGGGGARYRMLGTLRAFGLDRLAAGGEEDAAQERLVRWAVELTAWVGTTVLTEREPEADAVLRRELPNLRAAWRAARQRGAVDEAASMVTALFEAIGWRDLVELRTWADELAYDPVLEAHPHAAVVLGTAAYGAYIGGDHARAERLARTGLQRGPAWQCLLALSVAALARGDYVEVVEHALAAAEQNPQPRGHLGLAALGALYLGDPHRARELNDRDGSAAVGPTYRAWHAYYAGEIANATGDSTAAERNYLTAVGLARTAGTTFWVGVATVGLLTVRAAAGRVEEALEGYRDVIDYFARNGNWTHLWATLRNLAELMRRLGDHEPAAMIDTAADQAPDAPAIARTPAPAMPVPGRSVVLDIARQAIERNLSRL